MINFYEILLIFSILSIGISATILQKDGQIKHLVQIHHPGIHTSETIECTLIQVKNKENEADEFYMNVATVVCGDSRCRIDTIAIFWDELGFFKRLEIPNEVELEKSEGKHFNEADYQKLNNILSNRQSSLKDVYKDEVVGKETTEGVDGYTGATIVLHTDDYVKGAVWTCYTLWHWTNGNVYSIIRNITGDNLNDEELKILLKKEEFASKIFALEQIIRRKDYSTETIHLVRQQAQIEDYQLNKLILSYFENVPTDIFQNTMLELLKTKNSRQRQFFLNGIAKTKRQLPLPFFEKVSLTLSSWDDYPAINLFFEVLENKEIASSVINQEAISILNHKNFLIVRRAYWFLAEQELSKLEQDKLDAFYKNNIERL